jgi:hypothetical protein
MLHLFLNMSYNKNRSYRIISFENKINKIDTIYLFIKTNIFYNMLHIKDLDKYLANYLQDKDILNLRACSKYSKHVFDEDFWKKRFYLQYSKIIDEEYINSNVKKFPSWFDYYFEIKRFTIFFSRKDAIKYDRADVLSVFVNEPNIFGPPIFQLLRYTVEDDAINCFTFLYKKYYYKNSNKNYNNKISVSIEDVIHFKATKIFNYIICNNLENFSYDAFIRALDRRDINILKSLLSSPLYSNISILFSSLSYPENMDYIEYWISEYNPCVQYFLSLPQIMENLIRYKNQAFFSNNLHIVKLLTKYTSPFSHFAKYT